MCQSSFLMGPTTLKQITFPVGPSCARSAWTFDDCVGRRSFSSSLSAGRSAYNFDQSGLEPH